MLFISFPDVISACQRKLASSFKVEFASWLVNFTAAASGTCWLGCPLLSATVLRRVDAQRVLSGKWIGASADRRSPP